MNVLAKIAYSVSVCVGEGRWGEGRCGEGVLGERVLGEGVLGEGWRRRHETAVGETQNIRSKLQARNEGGFTRITAHDQFTFF